MNAPREIVILKPSSLGDIVHTLPAVSLLKRHWPQARLRWMVNTEWAPLLEGNPDIDAIVTFPRQDFRGWLGWTRIPKWAKTVATVPADLVLDFQGLLRSALIGRLFRAERGRVIGLSDAREGARFFYDQTVDVSGARHAVDRYLALVAALRVPVDLPLSWPLPPGGAPAHFREEPPFVLLHPFARGAGKSMSLAEVENFCRTVAPARVIVAGRGDQHVPALPNVENLMNRTTLAELIWLIRRANFVVSVDSGPMHIAAALTSRLISIHTWSDPREVGPYRPEARIWKDGALVQVKDLPGPETGEAMPEIEDLARYVTRHFKG